MVVSRPGNLGDGYLQRADIQTLREVFEKYASVRQGETLFLSYEDLIVRSVGFIGQTDESFTPSDTWACCRKESTTRTRWTCTLEWSIRQR